MKTLPILYQRSQTGAIQRWQICSFDNVIQTVHGIVGGKLTTATDTVHEGMNAGRSNATTKEEQAEREAQSKWTKKKKSGYVESLEDAKAGLVDATVILGGIDPMLSPNKSYPKDDLLSKKVILPCFFQPKLDGMRCTAEIIDGVATVWSRTRKVIATVPHIVEGLEEAFSGTTGKIIVDGELYNHDYKDRFEDLMSILRGDGPDEEGEYLNAQFHLYDCPEQNVLSVITTMNSDMEARLEALTGLFTTFINDRAPLYIKLVETTVAHTMEELVAKFKAAEEVEGYEGGMARNKRGKYEAGKRSNNLLKMKSFIDDEFPIEGVMDGRGNAENLVIKFVVRLPNGLLSHPTYKATHAKRRDMWDHPEKWRGKKLTVTFKRYTADGNLYIPVAKTVRDYE